MTLPGFHACQMCMGTGGVRIPCAFCRRGDPVHPHECSSCGGAGQVPDDDTVTEVGIAIWLAEYDDTPAIPEEWRLADRIGTAALLAYARHTQETK